MIDTEYGILTFHRAANYGAVLQAYALVKSIEQQGKSAEIIDYRSRSIEDYYNPHKLLHIKNWKRLIAYILYNGILNPDRERYSNFLKKHQVLSKIVYDDKELLKTSNERYKTFIAGSDQVWNYNTANFDKNYFLDFVSGKNRKTSYAASIGVAEIPEYLRDDYYQLLRSFECLSVREKSGADLLVDIGLSPVSVNLDPTLLLNKREWEAIVDLQSVRNEIKEKNNYVLIYLISENKALIDQVRSFAKKNNLCVCYINNRWRNSDGITNLRKVNVDEWLYLFDNASYIITDSFHGTAFSINFMKPFLTYCSSASKVSTRITDLLSLTHLQNHIFTDKQYEITLQDLQISYEFFNSILDKERDKSKQYIRQKIMGNNNE